MERERDVEKYLKKEIEKYGGMFFKFTSPGTDGVPDRIAKLPDGPSVFVEVKTDTGTLEPVQKYMIKKLRAIGYIVCVVHGKAGADAFLLRFKTGYSVDGEYLANGSWRDLDEIQGS
jgi:hypothetical protein